MAKKTLYIFNPEHDLALASGEMNYMPPASARRMASELALLPVWYAERGSAVLASSAYNLDYLKRMQELLDIPVYLMTEPELAAEPALDIRGSQPIKDGEEILGKLTKVKVVKNKVAPPFRRAEFDIMFGEGISHSGEIIDLGADLGIIKKSGSWYSYNDTKLGQGRDAAKQCIMDNPELAEELEGLIFEELKKK